MNAHCWHATTGADNGHESAIHLRYDRDGEQWLYLSMTMITLELGCGQRVDVPMVGSIKASTVYGTTSIELSTTGTREHCAEWLVARHDDCLRLMKTTL